MKKPNKLYRKLGGRRSRAGAAFAAVRHPVVALRNAFGIDIVARDAADNFSTMGVCKHSYQLVMQTIKGWGETYRGPKLSWIFKLNNPRQPRIPVDAQKPEFD